MSHPCSGCGSVVPGGAAGCRGIFDAFLTRDFSDPVFFRHHRLMVDIFCLQHPDDYCASAKSFAAHLAGLCVALDHGGNAAVYRAIQRWLNGPAPVEKPEIPYDRGMVTIADLQGVNLPADYSRALQRWSLSTWEAYASLHPLARSFVQSALRSQGDRVIQ
jgi:hypothetical protein